MQQVGNDAVDLRDFQANIFDDPAGRAGLRQVAANDVDYAGDSGKRIADFVGESGGEFAEGGEMFGARHLSAMQTVDFFAALAQLLDHLIEVTTEVADFIVAF